MMSIYFRSSDLLILGEHLSKLDTQSKCISIESVLLHFICEQHTSNVFAKYHCSVIVVIIDSILAKGESDK